MYYTKINVFDRMPTNNLEMEKTIPQGAPVEVSVKSETWDDALFWSVLGLSALGIIILICYVDSPILTN